VDVLEGTEGSGVDLADPVLICMHLCPWGLLGRLNDRADRDRQLTELTDQPICRMAGLQGPVAGFRTPRQSSPSTFRCINAYPQSSTTLSRCHPSTLLLSPPSACCTSLWIMPRPRGVTWTSTHQQSEMVQKVIPSQCKRVYIRCRLTS
jgi:hypothetical protein